MRTLLYFLVLAVLAAGITLADANVTGKWSGTFNSIGPDGEARESTTVMMLKQSGSEISGTFGPNESEQAMTLKGRIEADKITLAAEDEGRTVKFDLVLAADRIAGEVNMVHGGQSSKAKINVTRAK
jgi:hypothetical protein